MKRKHSIEIGKHLKRIHERAIAYRWYCTRCKRRGSWMCNSTRASRGNRQHIKNCKHPHTTRDDMIIEKRCRSGEVIQL